MDDPSPSSPAKVLVEAARLHQAGDLDAAEAAYRRILGHEPGHADATHLLGVLEHQRGRHDQAIGLISRAIALDPGRADYRNNLGVARRASGLLEQAVAAYREALAIAPAYPDSLANLGVALHELGVPGEARPPLEQALRLDPGHVNAAFALANLLREAAEPTLAVPLYRRARALAPARADILNNLAIALIDAGDAEGGLAAARRAVELAPDDPAIWVDLGSNLERLDRVEEAAEAYAAAARLRPDRPHWPIRIAAICPAVFPDAGSIDRYRIGLEAVLDAHRAGLRLDPEAAQTSGCLPPFHLAHHGRGDRAIRAKFAALFRDTFPARIPSPGTGIPRIGFVVTRGREGAFARGTAGIVDGLDPDRFRVAVFGAPSGLPALRAAIGRADAEFLPLPAGLADAAAAITAARCDVLYHWQVDTDPLGYLLPFARPAPVQCTSWGSHATTGIPAMDYYLSGEQIEPEGSEDHYTEELVRMATLPTFQRPVHRPGPPARRSEFGLPEGRHLYACLQRPAKIHPDFDAALAGILRRDPAGLVLLQGDPAVGAAVRLRARLRAGMPDIADRILFLPAQPGPAYRRLLSLADVALDPWHYGAGLTAYDILGLGLPLVTLPGSLHVGRYALGCYRRMGVAGPVARSPAEYVELAARLGLDREYRREVGGRIVAAVPALFEDPGAVAEHARFFGRAAAQARA
jgi:protein O-GlcNAc transferase